MKRVVNVCLVSWCAPTAADRATSAQVTIDVLLDDLLLEIFDLYREESTRRYPVKATWEWTTLAHVCRRWRAIIFASPRRLHLRVTCDPRTPVKTSVLGYLAAISHRYNLLPISYCRRGGRR